MKVLALLAALLPIAAPAQATMSSWEQVAANACHARAIKHWRGAQVRAVAVENDYALCSVGDRNVGGEMLMRLRGSYYVYVGGGGGSMAASDMQVLYHVPLPIAQRLVEKLQAALRARGYL